MDQLIGALEILQQQIELALENATEGARESHETWTRQLDAAEATGQPLPPDSLDEIQQERRHEMLCLGQAAGLAWVGVRLGTILRGALDQDSQQNHRWEPQSWNERETTFDR